MLCSRRSGAKLLCISAAMDRAMARGAGSAGQNMSPPLFSLRYSTIARLSHTTMSSPSHRIGTLPEDGANSSPSRRFSHASS